MELVHTIVAMGRNLGVDVVAEGVETAQQQDWLREVACRFAQGYWFARPMPGESAGALLGRVLPVSAGTTTVGLSRAG
jgi:EAL domain-containing protein (putative c-di-GMP-specific phosphodiesterase class I)